MYPLRSTIAAYNGIVWAPPGSILNTDTTQLFNADQKWSMLSMFSFFSFTFILMKLQCAGPNVLVVHCTNKDNSLQDLSAMTLIAAATAHSAPRTQCKELSRWKEKWKESRISNEVRNLIGLRKGKVP